MDLFAVIEKLDVPVYLVLCLLLRSEFLAVNKFFVTAGI
jgi:hypothetical protein